MRPKNVLDQVLLTEGQAMHRWEAVARRYLHICPEPADVLSPHITGRLRVWLEDDVVPILDEIVCLPRFQELATYSSRTLNINADTDERRLVARVEAKIVAAAQSLLNHPLVHAAPMNSTDGWSLSSAGTVDIDAAGGVTMTPAIELQSHPALISLDINQVQSIANKDWRDLTNVEDFFFTQQEFVESDDGALLQRGDMINSINPRLIPIGDLVARGLRHRIDTRIALLESLSRRLQLNQLHSTFVEAFAEWNHAYRDLDDSIRELYSIVFAHKDAVLRDSCAALTQTYAALHPRPNLGWLGLSDQIIAEARGRFPSVLTGHRGTVIYDRIARAVRDVGQLYRDIDPNASELDRAIATGGLVVHIPSQSAWWERKKIDLGPSGKNFEFLEALAKKSRRGQPVSSNDLYPDDPPSHSTMANRWNRLGSVLPGTLATLIGAVPVRSYRLTIDVSRLFIIG